MVRLFLQLVACIKRILLQKRREPIVTLLEILSHLIIIMLLVYGYSLSSVLKFDSKIYSQFLFQLPPLFLVSTAPLNSNLTQSLPDYTPYAVLPPGTTLRNNRTFDNNNNNNNNNKYDYAFEFEGLLSEVDKIFSGPLPIPDLNQYLTLNNFVSTSVPNNIDNVIMSSSIARGYANLLYKGSFHFAPEGENVDSLIDYLNATYPAFSTYSIYTHASEDKAIKFILRNANLIDRTLALVVLREISSEKINFVIRQNYSTLPNTNDLVDFESIGLNTDYQSYFVSGFLSIKSAVDEWALIHTGAISNDNSNSKCHIQRSGIGSLIRGRNSAFMQSTNLYAPFPTFAYNQNFFYTQVGFLLGLAMTMMTMYPLSRLTKSLVEDKESRNRELMMLSGLYDLSYQYSWFIVSSVLFFWIAISTTYVTTNSFLTNSDRPLIFLYFYFFCMSEVNLAFLLSTLFRSAKIAALVAPVILFVAVLPRYIFFSSNSNELWKQKYACSLISPTAFSFGADIIANYEYTGRGVTTQNMFEGDLNFAGILLVMFFDIFLYGFLAWYLDKVIPQYSGNAKHPAFILYPSYWRNLFKRTLSALVTLTSGKNIDNLSNDNLLMAIQRKVLLAPVPELRDFQQQQQQQIDVIGKTSVGKEEGDFISLSNSNSTYICEPIISQMISKVKVIISNVKKTYENGKVALQGVDCVLLDNQITCLLGHNGAGKSSLIGIMTGSNPISHSGDSGSVNIFGHEVTDEDDIQDIRQMIGVCPQQNILFLNLTVREHLNFYGSIKGFTGVELDSNVNSIVTLLGLFDYLDYPSKNLSGGNKRKLCLAIAFIGNPKLVVLDEPTSGMDPKSRRLVWNILTKLKQNKVVMLTTHYMDEAEILSDRVIILDDGKVRCSSSIYFLKNSFSTGFMLTIVIARKPPSDVGLNSASSSITLQSNTTNNNNKNSNDDDDDDDNNNSSGDNEKEKSDVWISKAKDDLFKKIKRIIPDCALQQSKSHAIQKEMVVELPKDCGKSDNSLSKLFYELEMLKVVGNKLNSEHNSHEIDFKIESYGISTVSLKHIFVKLCDHDDDALASPSVNIMNTEGEGGGVSTHFVTPNCNNSSSTFIETTSGLEMIERNAKIVDSSNTSSSSNNNSYSNKSGNLDKMEVASRDTAVVDKDLEDASKLIDNESRLILVPSDFDYEKQYENTYWFNAYTFFLQLFELYKKRFIIAKRDVKGLFYHIVFPSIQVLLILAILTIEINPAGRVLRLQSASFDEQLGFYPNIFVNSANSSIANRTDIGNNVCYSMYYNKSNLDNVYKTSLRTSYEVSEALLEVPTEGYDNFNMTAGGALRGSFYGGYVCNDVVPIEVDVEWKWVYETLVFLLNSRALSPTLVTSILNQINLTIANNVTFLVVKQGDQISIESGRGSSLISDLDVSTFINQLNITNSSSAITIGNFTFQLPSPFNIYNIINAANVSASVAIGSVSLRDGDLYLQNVLITSYLFNYSDPTIVLSLNSNTTIILLQILLNSMKDFVIANPDPIAYASSLPVDVTIMHNSTSPHGIAIFNSEMVKDVFRMCSSSKNESLFSSSLSSNSLDPQYVAKNHPLPVTSKRALEYRVILSLLVAIFIIIPLCYIPATLITFSVQERSVYATQIQYVSGVSPSTYWIATFAWDFSEYLVLEGLIIICFEIFGADGQAKAFIGDYDSLQALITLFLVYGSSSLSLCYLYSRHFEVASTAQISIMAFNFLTGFVTVLAYFIMVNIPKTKRLGQLLVWWFRIFPMYNIGEGMINISVNYYRNSLGKIISGSVQKTSYFSWDVTGRNIYFMILQSIGYFLLLLILESRISQNLSMNVSAKYGKICNFLCNHLNIFSPSTSNVTNTKNGFSPPISSSLSSDVGNNSINGVEQGGRGGVRGASEKSSSLEQQSADNKLTGNKISPQNLATFHFDSVDSGVTPDTRKDPVIISSCSSIDRNDMDVKSNNSLKSSSSTSYPAAISVSDLQKIYPPAYIGGGYKHVLGGISFEVQIGQIFGLLGVNGAGKSTIMGILTGNIPRTSGDVFVNGISVDNATDYLKKMGYCPQVDPLLELMTAEEMLWLYGRIRCIKKDRLKIRVDNLIDMIGLAKHKDRFCGTFSGGNKRKLSLGCAMIGDPSLLLLDEPSCGMDPIARNKMCKLIYKVANRRSVVLVSHAMDECETLCSTIAILAPFNKDKPNPLVDPAHGFLACGSPQQIKSHFKAGYDIEVRFRKVSMLASMFGEIVTEMALPLAPLAPPTEATSQSSSSSSSGGGEGEGEGDVRSSTTLPSPNLSSTTCLRCSATSTQYPIAKNGLCQICNFNDFLSSIGSNTDHLNAVYNRVLVYYHEKQDKGQLIYSMYEPVVIMVMFLSKLVESACTWSISEMDENFIKIRCELTVANTNKNPSPANINCNDHTAAATTTIDVGRNAQILSSTGGRAPSESDLDLHYLFSQLEAQQKTMCIIDYSISQLSLEHVFLSLTENLEAATAEDDDSK